MRRESYGRFWQRIHDSARKKSFPLRIMFEVTYDCNFKCKHCYIPPSYIKRYKKKELKTKEVFTILDQLKEMGCFYLGITGGEPFMRPDIMDILDHAKRCGFAIIIYTNGSLINKKIAGRLAKLNPNKVDITIPAVTEYAFERITGVSGSRHKVFEAARLLRANNVELGFKSCVLRDNVDQVGKIERYAISMGGSYRLADRLSPRIDGSRIPYGCRVKENSRRPGRSKRDTSLSAKEFFTCGAGYTQAAITPAGELKICLMIDHPKYKIVDLSFKKAWQKQLRFMDNVILSDNHECRQCHLIINDAEDKN